MDPGNGGELWAMMLDAKGDLRRPGGRPPRRMPKPDRVLNNRIYQRVSGPWPARRNTWRWKALPNFIRSRFDLLVLDTPPKPERA